MRSLAFASGSSRWCCASIAEHGAGSDRFCQEVSESEEAWASERKQAERTGFRSPLGLELPSLLAIIPVISPTENATLSPEPRGENGMAFDDSIPLPKDWTAHVKGALVRAAGLAHKALTHARGWAANSSLTRVRLAGENDRLQSEVALLKRELELVKARFERIPALKRPHYSPTERLAILELKAMRCWSAAEAARRMLLAPATIASWLDCMDRDGENGLLATAAPVNRFPDFVGELVQSLKATLPSMGKKRIADVLARGGLHLSVSTVARMLKRERKKPPKLPEPSGVNGADRATTEGGKAKGESRTVKATYAHHVWNLDITRSRRRWVTGPRGCLSLCRRSGRSPGTSSSSSITSLGRSSASKSSGRSQPPKRFATL